MSSQPSTTRPSAATYRDSAQFAVRATSSVFILYLLLIPIFFKLPTVAYNICKGLALFEIVMFVGREADWLGFVVLHFLSQASLLILPILHTVTVIMNHEDASNIKKLFDEWTMDDLRVFLIQGENIFFHAATTCFIIVRMMFIWCWIHSTIVRDAMRKYFGK